MGEIVNLTRTPESVLQTAIQENFKSVIVIGETRDGSTHVSMSMDDIPLAIFLLAVAKKALLEEATEGDE